MAGWMDLVDKYGMDPEDYARALERSLSLVDNLNATAVRMVFDDLVDLRKGITASIADGMGLDPDAWTLGNLQRVEGQIDDVLRDWVRGHGDHLIEQVGKAADIGVDMTPGAIRAGTKAPASAVADFAVPKISRRQLETALVGPIPELVQNLSHNARTAIGHELKRTVLGAQAPGDAMRGIRRYLATPERGLARYGPLAYQAERVFRTEIGRAFNLANQAGILFTRGRLGDAGMSEVWSHSGLPGARPGHAALDQFTIPAGEYFNVNGHRAKGPHDPSLPPGEVINCRCTKYLWNDRWGGMPRGPKPQGTSFFKSPRARRNGWKPGDRPAGLGALARGQKPIGPPKGRASAPTVRAKEPPARSSKYPSAAEFRQDLAKRHRANEARVASLREDYLDTQSRYAVAPADGRNIGALTPSPAESIDLLEAKVRYWDSRLDELKEDLANPLAGNRVHDMARATIADIERSRKHALRYLDDLKAGRAIEFREDIGPAMKAKELEWRQAQQGFQAEVRELLRTGNGLDVRISGSPPNDLREAWEQGARDFGDLFDRDAFPEGLTRQARTTATGFQAADDPLLIRFRTERNRAYYDPRADAVHVGGRSRTVIHELGHWLENHSPKTQDAALNFLADRVEGSDEAGRALKWMGDGYRQDELAWDDRFLPGLSDGRPGSYAGKPYMNGRGRAIAEDLAAQGKDVTPRSIAEYHRFKFGDAATLADIFTDTEIISMGIEYYWSDTLTFAEGDPEYFDFIYNLVRGLS